MTDKDIEKLNNDAVSGSMSDDIRNESVDSLLETVSMYDLETNSESETLFAENEKTDSQGKINNNGMKTRRNAKGRCSNRETNLWSIFQNRMRNLSKSFRIQLIAATVLTVLLIAAIPVIAWFSSQNEMIVSTKVNSPATLEIKSGGPKGAEQKIINFELSDIDTEDTSYNHYPETNV